MKKILSVLLVCAMFLPLLASCGSLQAGELDVAEYAEEAIYETIGYTPTTGDAALRKELSDDPEKVKVSTFSGTLDWGDFTWYLEQVGDPVDGTETPVDSNDDEIPDSYTLTRTVTVRRKTVEKDGDYSVYTISNADQFRAFFSIRYQGKETVDDKEVDKKAFSLTTTEKITVDEQQYDCKVTTNYYFVENDTATYYFEKAKVLLDCDVVMNALDGGVTEVDSKADFARSSPYAIPAIGSTGAFKGVFDGQRHVISGVYYSCGSVGTRGFFGPLSGEAKLLNFSIVDSYFLGSSGSDKSQIGCLTTAASGTHEFSNIYLNVYMTQSGSVAMKTIGGFIGTASGTVTFNNCVFHGTLNFPNASQTVGGFVGSSTGQIEFTNCCYEGPITATAGQYVGGFIGQKTSTAATFTSCTHNGAISGTKDVGGFVGNKGNSRPLTVTSSSNLGSITASGDNVGGFIGNLTQGPLVFTDCSNAASVSSSGNNVGGFAGYVPGSRKLSSTAKDPDSFTGCSNTGDISGNYRVGGLMGQRDARVDFVADGFVNSGNISGVSQIGGLIGKLAYSDTKTSNTIRNSRNEGTVTATGNYVAGIVAEIAVFLNYVDDASQAFYTTYKADHHDDYVKGSYSVEGGKLIITDTRNSGNISAGVSEGVVQDGTGNFAGGVLGYLHGDSQAETIAVPKELGGSETENKTFTVKSILKTVQITNCVNSGDMKTNRCVGGIAGFVQRAAETTIDGCEMSGNMNVRLSSNNNNNAGGILGRTDSVSLYFANNAFTGSMTVDCEDCIPNDQGKYVAVAYVGGLIGYLYNTNSYVSYCTVSGDMTVTNKDTVTDTKDKNEAHIFVGGASKKVNVYNGLYFDPTESTITATDFTPVLDYSSATAAVKPEAMLAGYQVRSNGEGVYDLRVVAATKVSYEAAGFVVTLKYKDGETVHESMQTVYADTIYTSVTDDEREYRASDYKYDYLYTLVISGIPEEYSFANENLELQVIPFSADKDDETQAITYYTGSGRMIGTDLNHSAENHSFGVNDFATSLGSLGYENEDIVASVTSDQYATNPCLHVFSGSVADIAYHYPNTNTQFVALKQEKELSFMTYTFEVESDGVYDIVVKIREGQGSSDRRAYLLFDAESGADVHYIQYKYDAETYPEWANKRDNNTQNSYVTVIEGMELSAGTHTITLRGDSSISAAWHFREYIIVKAK